ncbi:MAG TPA: CapA family protein [Candidatus Portnoybacteria bacterium]|jgi:gamma-polyglutamate biosynthesis protein CapA|nr:CapA family protein [Candidatus Portnoybacteria bacterium]MDD5752293.1 CapA family protein [Candidatus Portnoybacteria bacterium]HNU96792.1 CapA family protein [Candidatus Portnoybacteria bacterium]HOZ16285.1 CapA family protein [Candidatus Portnoybacteria bacterium]HPH51919.1 CapA family protein [Candidatus Portnoybacteria bacterium]
MMKKVIIFTIIIGLSIAVFFVFRNTRNFDFKNQNSAQLVAPKIKKVSILAFGDMMLDRVVYSKTLKAGDYNFPFQKIDDFLKTADIKFANLEGPITNFKSISNGNTRMRFTVSPEFLPVLKERFNVLSLANNHMLDFGEAGYIQAKNYLSEANINYFGNYHNQQENLSTIIEKNEIKIGFIGYHGLIEEGFENALEEIKKIRPQVDFLIVVPHWGAEYKEFPADSTIKKAKQFIDVGADLILGGHPHVVQPSEEYKGKKIYYSLGNFIFDQYWSEETMQGLAVEILLEKSDNKIKAEYKEYKIKINQDSQPEIIN